MSVQKVNCRVIHCEGGKHLVFTLEGTTACVGDIVFKGDPQYLLVMAQMFARWATQERGGGMTVQSAVNHHLNGNLRLVNKR